MLDNPSPWTWTSARELPHREWHRKHLTLVIPNYLKLIPPSIFWSIWWGNFICLRRELLHQTDFKMSFISDEHTLKTGKQVFNWPGRCLPAELSFIFVSLWLIVLQALFMFTVNVADVSKVKWGTPPIISW